MGSINILSTSYQFRPGQILVPNSERQLSHQVFLGFQNYIYSTFTSTTKRGLLWTCWHIKKSKILNFHRYRTIRVMRMNGQSWVFQHRRQKQGWRGVLTSAAGTRGQPCRRAASATRAPQGSTQSMVYKQTHQLPLLPLPRPTLSVSSHSFSPSPLSMPQDYLGRQRYSLNQSFPIQRWASLKKAGREFSILAKNKWIPITCI